MNNSYEMKILQYMSQKEYRSKNFDELKEIFEIKNSKKEREFKEALSDLEKQGKIVRTHKKQYNLPSNLGMVIGRVANGSKAFLFVADEKTGEEYFVPPNHTKNAFAGDRVIVSVSQNQVAQDGNKRNAKVVKVLNRDNEKVVGTYIVEDGESFVDINIKGASKRLKVAAHKNAVEGHEVLVELEDDEDMETWVITEILGHKDEPTTEILSVLYRHGIKTEFDEDTLDESDAIPNEIPEMEYYMRADLREKTIITIDGADSKDLDDAIYLTKNENGNYVLGVHIADVSFYVEQDSSLDREAYERGTSVYLTDRVVPMLPQKLSNGICSLHPGVDRLTLSCEMEIDSKGNVVSHEIFQSVINSRARLTYDEVNEMIEGTNAGLAQKYPDVYPIIMEMQKLSLLLRQKRQQQGAIDFDAKEAKVIVDSNNVPLQIKLRDRKNSERLIEEFMLIANETVATHFTNLGLPFIYRIHDNPKEEKVRAVSDLVTKLGYTDLYIENATNPKQIQRMLEGVKGTTIEKTIQTLAIRMMAKAIYSDENTGHFGLSKEFYTHFTSPIRRYPDLIVHRLIREFLIDHKTNKKTRDFWKRELGKIGEQTSKMEQKAADAEREMLERKKAEFISQFVGDEFDGVVSSITEYGMYIELENTVQGLVTKNTLKGDYFFDEDAYVLRSMSGMEDFIIGDKVKIRVLSASKETQQVDFEFVSKY